jgi:hypothetical protein
MNLAALNDSTPYILLLVGLVLILVPLLSKNSRNRLAGNGLCSEGVIFKLDYQRDSNWQNTDSVTKNKITVRFVTETKEWITADLNTNGLMLYPGQFKEGQAVTVRYDPANPTDFTLEKVPGQRVGRILFIIMGILLMAIGCYMMLGGSLLIKFNQK